MQFGTTILCSILDQEKTHNPEKPTAGPVPAAHHVITDVNCVTPWHWHSHDSLYTSGSGSTALSSLQY